MATLLICLFIVILMPFIAKIPLAMAMNKLGGYDNRYPRQQQSQLTGFGARAKAGHENAFEAIIIFAPSILAVIAVGAVDEVAKSLAMLFVGARIGYHIMYLLDKDKLRSLLWVVALFSSLALMIMAIRHVG
ncbi:MAPEG family protein [Alteromonadaceae bacterium M269]|nr:MAPEG family protein [Alteromonadaceae bacterium M269]